jgi:uncharacterized membrane protein YeiH
MLTVPPVADLAVEPAASWAFEVLALAGTAAFAVSGAAAAMRARMDLVGVVVLAMTAAVGGGSLRDLALGNLPMWWVADWWALLVAVAAALLLVPMRGRFARYGSPDSWRTVLVADAVGLAAFVVIGASLTLQLGFPGWLAVLMGVLTGVGGGVLRDVLAATPPLLFTGQVYATAALIGAVLFVGLAETGLLSPVTYWSAMFAVLGVRLLAVRRNWALPPLHPTG